MREHLTPDQVERFWAKVDRSGGPDACWPWLLPPDAEGYGRVRFGKTSKPRTRKYRAHRVAWELTNGPTPDGLCVLHRCDNRPCCNPTHLFLGTRVDNNADRDTKGRGAARLTANDVVAIRRDHVAGVATRAELSQKYGVGHATIWAILHRRSWANAE